MHTHTQTSHTIHIICRKGNRYVLKLCANVCLWLGMCMWVQCLWGPEGGIGFPVAGVTVVVSCPVWVLGIELGSGARAVHALNWWAISLVHCVLRVGLLRASRWMVNLWNHVQHRWEISAIHAVLQLRRKWQCKVCTWHKQMVLSHSTPKVNKRRVCLKGGPQTQWASMIPVT